MTSHPDWSFLLMAFSLLSHPQLTLAMSQENENVGLVPEIFSLQVSRTALPGRKLLMRMAFSTISKYRELVTSSGAELMKLRVRG
jgi:hypothetical protein